MTECIFCNIVAEKIPAWKIYETEEILAFLDIFPVQEGHTLVIPKKHYEQFLDTPQYLFLELADAVKKIVPAIQKVFFFDAFTLTQNNGSAARQTVAHAHWHIIPRREDDGLQMWPQGTLKDGKEISQKIRNELQK